MAEYFCFQNDSVWNLSDEEIRDITVEHLGKLDFFNKEEVLDCCVMRNPEAYPIFEVGYNKPYDLILDYLDKFKNLQFVGRSGKFKYFNMDHALVSGMEAAKKIKTSSRTTS